MRQALQLPAVRQSATQVGRRRWRKQVLPIATVEHPRNGTLHFTRDRLRRLVDRFRAGAYDTVPFLLADAENRHHSDVDKMRGEVKDLDLGDDGLYADIEATDRGADLLSEFPSLPVSVRLMPEPDGRGEALAHVLATLDPVIKGMRSWQPVDASMHGAVVIDLSAGTYLPLADAHDAGDALERATARIEQLETEIAEVRASNPGGKTAAGQSKARIRMKGMTIINPAKELAEAVAKENAMRGGFPDPMAIGGDHGGDSDKLLELAQVVAAADPAGVKARRDRVEKCARHWGLV